MKRQAISDVLGKKLPEQDLDTALRVCEEELAPGHEATASGFFQRLSTTLPHASFGKETRLLILRTLRSPATSLHETANQAASSSGAYDTRDPIPPRHPRKLASLRGHYQHTQNEAQTGGIVVENLSPEGARVHCSARIPCKVTIPSNSASPSKIRSTPRSGSPVPCGGWQRIPSAYNFSYRPAFPRSSETILRCEGYTASPYSLHISRLLLVDAAAAASRLSIRSRQIWHQGRRANASEACRSIRSVVSQSTHASVTDTP